MEVDNVQTNVVISRGPEADSGQMFAHSYKQSMSLILTNFCMLK
jgi:hypothetical protein